MYSRINIQTCVKRQVSVCIGLAINKPVILLAKGANRALVNLILIKKVPF